MKTLISIVLLFSISAVILCMQKSSMEMKHQKSGERRLKPAIRSGWNSLPVSWGKRRGNDHPMESAKGEWEALSGSWGKRSMGDSWYFVYDDVTEDWPIDKLTSVGRTGNIFY